MRFSRVVSLVFLTVVCALESRAQWVPMFAVAADYLQSVAVLGTDAYAAWGNGGIFHSSDCGATWIDITNNLPERYVGTVAVSPGHLFAGIYDHGVFHSTNDGSSWTACGDMLLEGYFPFTWIRSLAVHDTVVYAGGDAGCIFYSRDYGASWVRIDIDSTRGAVYDLLVSDSTIFAGVNCPGCPGGGVWVSNDDGVAWRSANVGLPFPGLHVNRFAASGTDLFAAGGAINANPGMGVYRSTNGGEVWTVCNTGGLPGLWVTDLAVSGEYLFAASGGVFASANKGESWTNFPEGLPWGGRVLAVCGEYLLTGSQDMYVYRRPLSELVVSVPGLANEFPPRFELRQNYPNPFNPSTTIRYALPEHSSVTLSVFNTLGQKVAVLLNEEQGAGYHEALFDASGLASGVYVCMLQAGSHAQTRKMVIVK